MGAAAEQGAAERLRAVERALAEGRPREALDLAGAVVREHPGRPEPRFYSALALARMGEREASLRFLGEAARLGRDDAGMQRAAGQAFAELGGPDAARTCLRRACALDPADFQAHFALGVVCERGGAFPEAERAYRRALALAEPGPEAGSGPGSGLKAGSSPESGPEPEAGAGSGPEPEAEPDAGGGDAGSDGDPVPAAAPVWVGLGNAERAQGRLDDAAESYRRAAAADPGHAPAWNNLGGLLRELGRPDEAEAAWRKAVEHVPGHLPAWVNLAGLLDAAERHDEAAAAWSEAASLAPRDADVRSGLGMAEVRAGRPREAIASFGRALADLTPERPRIISDLGRLRAALALAHLRAGSGEDALAACDAWLARRPGDATTLAAKAIVCNELGRADEARRLTGAERLAGHFRIDPTPDYPDLARFNEALARYVVEHPSLAYAPPHNATRKGLHSGELVTGPDGPAPVLKARILECVERYAAALEEAAVAAAADEGEDAPERILLASRPPGLRMRMWGVVMHAEGHQIPHIHPGAWLSGVYYPQVPDFVRADDPEHLGWLEFGRPPEGEFPDVKPMPVDAFLPEEGLLVVFPAWLYHRTVPYPADARRISVAFDLVPSDPPDLRRLLGG